MAVAVVAGVAFSFTPPKASAVGGEGKRYVALGDSVAAGLGLPQGIGVPEEQACGRSEQAYPYQVAAAAGMYPEHLACSGAKADEGLYGPQTVGPNSLPPQLDRAFAAGTPDVITITIGANDARWTEFLGKCYQQRCGTYFDDAAIAVLLTDLRWELHRTLATIKHRSGTTPPQVILTGYFIPFNTANITCNDTRNFTVAEMNWMNAQVANLNQAIRNVTSWYGFADYAPVDFSGHELCSNDPWIQGLQDPAPFHPTAGGQAAMARNVLAVLQ